MICQPRPPCATLAHHPLKDLSRSEQMFQLVTPDLPADFPPLRTLDAQPARSPPAAAPLLATKLFIPAPRPQLVPRPRLLDRLAAGLAGHADPALRAGWVRQDHAAQRLDRRIAELRMQN